MVASKLIPAVAYVRMSTDKQEDSPARQRGEIERMAQREGFRILHWYEDHGLTGTESQNRPEFQQMLRDAPRRQFSAVLLYEHSRFSREDVFDAMSHWKTLRDAGVKLVSVQRGELRFDDLAGLITAIVSQHESRGESIRIAQRSLSGRERAARKGVHLVRPPFGYEREILDESGQVVKRVPFTDTFVRPRTWSSRLVPASDPAIVDAVRYGFQAILDGKSRRSIAIEWNRRGLRTRTGQYFTTSRIRDILRNPVYAGVLRFGYQTAGKFARLDEETVYVENAHPAIVSLETFEAVQNVIGVPQQQNPTEPGRYLLAGLVYCAHCGRRMTGVLQKSQSYQGGEFRRYRCGVTQDGQEVCPAHPVIRADELERLVLRLVRDFVLSDENQAALMAAAQDVEAKRRLPSLEEQQLADVRRKIERGTQNLALAEGDDFDAIKKLLATWRDQERKLVARISAQAGNAAQTGRLIEAVADLAQIRNYLHLANRVLLASALRQSIVQITVRKEVRRNRSNVLRMTSGTIEFASDLTSAGPIPFDDWEFDPEQTYVQIARYVREAERPVQSLELIDAMNLPTAAYHARRAHLAGLISYDSVRGWRSTGIA